MSFHRWPIALILSLGLLDSVDAQPTGGNAEPPNAPNGNAPLTVTISADPPAQLPIGVDVQLTATHDPVLAPSYLWQARCIHSPFLRTESHWLGSTINTGCMGNAGTQRFYCDVSHQSPSIENPGKGHLDLTWNPPDTAFIAVSPPFMVAGPHEHAAVNITTSLKWNESLIGACAAVCTGETWYFLSTHPCTRVWHRRKAPPWWPNCTTPSQTASIYGSSANPNPTWHWQSPTLIDVNASWPNVADVPTGTRIGRKGHRYRFVGNYCDGTQWTLYSPTLFLDLVVRNVDGEKHAVFEPST